jgi:hypothetical protein
MASIDRIKFRGSIGNRDFKDITVNEFLEALAKCGWREAHNGHIYKSLVERGAPWGIRTPNDFARALRAGATEDGDRGEKRRVCCHGKCWVIYRGNRFITLTGPTKTK